MFPRWQALCDAIAHDRHVEQGRLRSVKDFEAFCRQSGNERVSFEENGGEYIFRLRKT